MGSEMCIRDSVRTVRHVVVVEIDHESHGIVFALVDAPDLWWISFVLSVDSTMYHSSIRLAGAPGIGGNN